MIKSIDHIVILVHDLEAAVRDYTELGFTVVQGGEHAGGVSRNALIAFSDGSYLELIAFTDNVVPESHPFYRPNNPEGLVTYALLPTDIEADIQSARERGLTLDGPFPGGRLRPDGNRIAWQTARPLTNDLPFLCGDITPRDLRVPSGAARVHKNGALGIHRINISVASIEDSIRRYRALLGSEPVYQRSYEGSYSAEFKLGDSLIDLASGKDWYSEERGEGPDALLIYCDEEYAWGSPQNAEIYLLPRSTEPVKVDTIEEEYQYIADLPCSRCGGHYKVTGQSLLLPPDRPPMDIIEIICVQCSQSNSVSFDISTFYGK